MAAVIALFFQFGDDPAPTQAATAEAPRTIRSFHALAEQLAAIPTSDSDLPVAGTKGYREVSADSGDVSTEVPLEWFDISTTNWLNDDNKTIGAAIISSPRIDGLYDGYATPGVFIGASPAVVPPADLLAARTERRSTNCRRAGEGAFDGEGFTGRYALWARCGPGDMAILDLAANDAELKGTLAVHIRLASRGDVEAGRRVLTSLDADLRSVFPDVGSVSPGFLID
ncbi:hypothetical protein SAMN04489867_0230 [Pedococcus dokdonensis]|uniref:Uncharacterized protein n=1 Tax=Pedococcus dokdonensis TaxID=443156 RepID=A0A1H0L9Q3_9MICO|nr:hypothetical protein [Pedococcus dokdonensis]SDO64743.1 hypothetical protein SAMN04489867_0230 [Pedococcus dokdonensis]